MTIPLTTAQIDAYDKLIQANGLNAVHQMYAGLYDKGFQYAGWAKGVAQGSSTTGQAALAFMDATAVMGYGGKASQTLSQSQVDKIRVDMARAFLLTLKTIALDSGGTVSRDVTFQEAKAFHSDVFSQNGLSIDNWTLTIPFELIQSESGGSEIESKWQELRDTGGDGLIAMQKSLVLLLNVFFLAVNGKDAQTRSKALQWAEVVPGQIGSVFNQLIESNGATLPWNAPGTPVGTTGQADFQKALMSVVADYFDLAPEGVTTLFDASDNRLSFDFSQLTSDLQQLRSLPLLTTAVSKLDEKSAHFVRSYAQDAIGWHVQSGTGSLNWTASSSDNQAAIGGTEADAVVGSIGHDLLMGLAGADTLQGKAGSDLLVGGDDADQLDGGDDSDYLYGGAGSDEYVFTGDFGNDWIDDSDGSGRITVDGTALPSSNAKKISANNYRDKATGWLFSQSDAQADGTSTLVITNDKKRDSSIVIRNWKSGQFGITLNDTKDETVPSTNIFKGDQRPDTIDDEYLWGDVVWTVDGALVTRAWPHTSIVEENFADVIRGTRESDDITGLGGNDALSGRDGDDNINGGTGDDLLSGGHGSDTIIGGAGNDEIWSGAEITANQRDRTSDKWTPPLGAQAVYISGPTWGVYQTDDQTYKVNAAEIAPSDDKADYIEGDAGNDNITASFGNDIANGGADNDSLTGLGGNDVLNGGAGHDFINGDGIAESGGLHSVPSDLNGNDILDGGSGNDTIAGGGGQDIVIGGDDDDRLWGDGTNEIVSSNAHGNDLIDGGEGNDQLTGGGDNDQLFGGAGQDSLWGDDNQSNLSVSVHGQDLLDGGAGDDFLIGGGQSDTLIGDDGADSLWGDDQELDVDKAAHGHDYLSGGNGNDQMTGGGDSDDLYGGDGNDILHGDDRESNLSNSVHGNDLLVGEKGKDTLYGGGKDDTLFGGTEDDILWGDGTNINVNITAHGKDLIEGGEGADQLVGGGAGDQLFGGTGADSIFGDDETTNVEGSAHGADLIDGGDGDDVIFGDGGNDTVIGGAGNDFIAGEHQTSASSASQGSTLLGDDLLLGGDGNDVLLGGEGADTLDGGTGSDVLVGGAGSDLYQFGYGSGADVVHLTSSDGIADVIQVGAGLGENDIIFTRSTTDLMLSINDGADNLTLKGFFTRGVDAISLGGGITFVGESLASKTFNSSARADKLSGYTQSEFIFGDAGNDTISGGGGNDTLNGGTGNDSLSGGTGADTYLFGPGSGQDILNNQDSEAVGTNPDTVQLGAGITSSTVTLVRELDNLRIKLNGSTDSLLIQYYFSSDATTAYAVENIKFADNTVWDIATVKSKLLMPTADRDKLYGYASNDLIDGGAGGDDIHGGDGNDTITGGSDNDRLYGDVGNDSLVGNEHDDDLYGGAGNDTLDGSAGNDTLDGGAGNDTLDGGAGNDYLYGRTGSDVYLFGTGSDKDTVNNQDGEAVGTNPDTVQLGAGITPSTVTLVRESDNLRIKLNGSSDSLLIQYYFSTDATTDYAVENIKFADNTVWDIATVKSKILQPTNGNDTQYGYASSDTIHSGDGNDSVFGNAGDDSIEGGTGADNLQGGEGHDIIIGGIGKDTLYGGNGNDSLSGNEYDDTLYGDAGNDTLDGGASNDNMQGGAGADVYVFGRGYGQDTINNSDSDAAGVNADTILLGADIGAADLTFTRTGDDLRIRINGSDDSLCVQKYFQSEGSSQNVIENFKFADNTLWDVAAIKLKALISTIGNDTITGYSTNDKITGNDGQDRIYGYGGDDSIDGEIGHDFLSGGEGNDSITGGMDEDWLNGESGNDTLDGGRGNDYLDGGAGSDIYLFGRGSGQDEISNADSNAVAADVDTILIGAGIAPTDITLTRSSYDGRHKDNDLVISINGTDDTLTVQSFFAINPGYDYTIDQIKFNNNTIWYLATIKSKVSTPTSDDDSLYGYSSNDTILGGDGNDLIYGYAGDDSLEGGMGADELRGGDGQDVLLGNNGNDTLYGIEGNDTLNGGSGNDSLMGNEGSDTYVFGKGSGNDRVSNTDLDAVGINPDTIALGAGIDTTNISLSQSGDDLIVSINGTDDSLRVEYYFSSNGTSSYVVENLKFADDTIWNYATVKSKLSTPTPATGSVLNGGAASESLSGGAGNDTINGNAGNDTLDGGAGNDALNGGSGNDTYIFGKGSGKDSINAYDSTAGKLEVIRLSSGVSTADVTLKRDVDALVLTINNTNDSLRINRYFANDATGGYQIEQIKFADTTIWDTSSIKNKVLTGSTDNDILIGYASADAISGSSGDDNIAGRYGNDSLEGGAGHDRLDGEDGNDSLEGGDHRDELLGGNGSDILLGQDGDDVLIGNADNDTLSGGFGDDLLEGGTGNDSYLFDIGWGHDTIYAGYTDADGKRDVIELGAGVLSTDVALQRHNDDLLLSIKSTNDTLRINHYFDEEVAYNYLVEKIKFADNTIWDITTIKNKVLTDSVSSAKDIRIGYEAADSLSGLGGDDVIVGAGGDDTLDGGEGNDDLYGGVGNDSLLGGSQNDLLIGYSGSDQLMGHDGDDKLIGDDDDDTLDGGAGNDDLDGGTGDDTYLFGKESGNDTISVYDNLHGKLDLVQLGTDVLTTEVALKRDGNALVLSINGTTASLRVNNYFLTEASGIYPIEKIQFADNTTWDANTIKNKVLAGSSENDTLPGYASNDAITGLSGDDSISGGSGDDTVDGGAGGDELYGGDGNDRLLGGSHNDTITGDNGKDTLEGQDGNDSLNGGADHDRISGGLGDDSLDGFSGNDIVAGDAGNDTLNGGEGASSQTVSSLVIHARGTLVGSVGPSMEVWIDGTKVQTFSVNSTAVTAYTVTAPLGMNAKTIDIAFTNDAYAGSEDRNLYVEKIVVSGSEIMGNAVGVITDYGSGTGAFDWSNVYRGNGSIGGNGAMRFGLGDNDYLNGGAGNDNMTGGVGNDVYVVDSVADKLTESTNEGYDFVESNITYTLADNIEHLTLTGTTNINGIGNALNNMMVGNSGINQLDGGAGADFMVGGGGNDTYIVDTAGDVCYENAGAGVDAVKSSITYTLSSNLENLTLTGTAAINGVGNSLANELTGNSANNTLYGGAGNDLYRGGAGSDSFSDSDTTSADRYVWGRNEGSDTLADAGGADQLEVLAGVSADQLWLQKSGNNLVLSVIGTSDKVTINNWYANAANQVEVFKLADGKSLSNTKVDNLVNAMASFTPPAAGQTTLPANYQTSLNGVIAANWQ